MRIGSNLVPAVLLLCIVAGCSQGNKTKPPAKKTVTANAEIPVKEKEASVSFESVFMDATVGIDFPDFIAGLTHSKTQRYPEKGLGYSVGYVNNELTMSMDVFVYDKLLPDIQDGFDNQTVRRQMAEERAIKQFYTERGIYRNVTEIDGGLYPKKTHFDAPMFQWSRLRLNRAKGPGVVVDGDQITETFIRGHKKHLIKIRISYPSDNSDDCEKVRKKAIARLVKMLKLG